MKKSTFTTRNGFTLIELMIVMVLLAILVAIGTGSFMSSQKKSRDAKRKADLRQVAVTLEAYYNDMGRYPAASGGQMMGCGIGASGACAWGGAWSNTSTTPETVYMYVLPTESVPGRSMYYATDAGGTYFRLYGLLENTQDEGAGVNQGGYSGTNCGGSVLCTYGISSTNTTP